MRALATPEDIGPCHYLLKIHLISCRFTPVSANDPWKLIGSAIDDISVPLILLGEARRAEARGGKRDHPKWKPLSEGHIGNTLMIVWCKLSDILGCTDTTTQNFMRLHNTAATKTLLCAAFVFLH